VPYESLAAAAERVQLHLVLPYKIETRRDPRVRTYLERGYRIETIQRVTDREVLVTLANRRAEEAKPEP